MKTKPKKQKRVRAVRGVILGDCDAAYITSQARLPYGTRVAILDVSDPEAVVEQSAKALYERRMSCRDFDGDWGRADDFAKTYMRGVARLVLESLNLIPERRAKK
jgi:hypothetical protein